MRRKAFIGKKIAETMGAVTVWCIAGIAIILSRLERVNKV